MSSSHVCIDVKHRVVHWNSDLLLLHLNNLYNLLSLKALVWELFPECVCNLYSGMQLKIEQCDLFSHFLLHTWNCSGDISMENCLSSIDSKEVTISALFKRGLLDFFRYYQIFILFSQSHLSILLHLLILQLPALLVSFPLFIWYCSFFSLLLLFYSPNFKIAYVFVSSIFTANIFFSSKR